MKFKAVKMRADFPALGTGLALFDAPGGTQVPEQVADAIRETMLSPISNRSPASVPGRNAEEAVHLFRLAAADLMGADSKGVVHGRSSTQLTMDFSRTLSKSWVPGDNIVLSKLDHDSNIAPWLIAAARSGVEVRWAQFDATTSELDTNQYESLIDEHTQVVAITAASNFIGSKPEVSKIAAIAHAHNAYVYVDAVHYAAHDPLDIKTLGGDFTVVSPYKLFGPHLGILAADPELLETVQPDKLRPSPNNVPERFELGTLPYEQLAGVTAMVEYIAGQVATNETNTRRERLIQAMHAFDEHELRLREIIERETADFTGLKLHSQAKSRTSTLLFTLQNKTPQEAETVLASHGVVAQAGHFYAMEASNALGLGEQGGLRVGLAPYNTDEDVNRLIAALAEASG